MSLHKNETKDLNPGTFQKSSDLLHPSIVAKYFAIVRRAC